MYRPRPYCMNTSKDSPILLILFFCILPFFNGGLVILFLFGMAYLMSKFSKVGGE